MPRNVAEQFPQSCTDVRFKREEDVITPSENASNQDDDDFTQPFAGEDDADENGEDDVSVEQEEE